MLLEANALMLYLFYMATTRNKQRTYARNRAFSRRGNEKIMETDGKYFLKLVLCFILGTLWIKFKAPLMIGDFSFNGLPVGFLFGVLVVSQFEKLQYNRKIWYAILIVVTVVSYFLPAGIVI